MNVPEEIRVLVVDDEEDTRRLLFDILSDRGYDVTMAADGREGLTRVREESYDLVITDLRMPERDGIEVLQDLRRAHPKTRVILYTAYPSTDSFVRAVDDGVDAYVEKPCKVNQLLSVVQSVLSRDAGTGASMPSEAQG